MAQDCIFCKIAAKEIPVKLVHEDEHLVAFHDINPAAPVHVLVIPKRHIDHIMAISNDDGPLLGHVMTVIPAIAAKLGLGEDGFRVVLNTKESGGQTVFHIHWHILGGRAMHWPPG